MIKRLKKKEKKNPSIEKFYLSNNLSSEKLNIENKNINYKARHSEVLKKKYSSNNNLRYVNKSPETIQENNNNNNNINNKNSNNHNNNHNHNFKKHSFVQSNNLKKKESKNIANNHNNNNNNINKINTPKSDNQN